MSNRRKTWIAVGVLALFLAAVFFKESQAGYKQHIKKAEDYEKNLEKLGFPNGDIITIFHSESADHLFISAENSGLLRNNGNHWQIKMNGIVDLKARIYALAEDIKRGIIYVATDDGVYKSDNYGDDWTRYSKGLPYETHSYLRPSIYNLDVDQESGDVYTRVGLDGYGIWKRGPVDGEWFPIGEGLPAESIISDLCFSSKERVIYVSVGYGNVLVVSNFEYNMGVYKGINIGERKYKWENTGLPVNKKKDPVRDVTVDPITGDLYALSAKGVFRNNRDGWEKILNNTQTYISSFEKEKPFRALIVAPDRVYLRSGKDDKFNEVTGGWDDYASVRSATFYKGSIYIGTNDGLYASADDGNTWTLLTKDLDLLVTD